MLSLELSSHSDRRNRSVFRVPRHVAGHRVGRRSTQAPSDRGWPYARGPLADCGATEDKTLRLARASTATARDDSAASFVLVVMPTIDAPSGPHSYAFLSANVIGRIPSVSGLLYETTPAFSHTRSLGHLPRTMVRSRRLASRALGS